MSARLSSLLVAGGMVLVGQPVLLGANAVASEANPAVPAISGATLRPGDNGKVDLVFMIPAYSGTPRLQVLNNTRRVVVDLPGVDRGSQISRKDQNAWKGALILKSRLAQFSTAPEAITRLVLEVVPGTQVSVASQLGMVRLSLAAGTGAVQAANVPWSDALPVSSPLPETHVASISERPVVLAPVVTTDAAKPLPSLNALPEVGGGFGTLPALAVSTLLPARPTAVPLDKAPTIVAAQVARNRDESRGRTLGESGGGYTGAKMSIDVTGTDINAILKIIASTGHLNLAADNDVQGLLTLKFDDCPWDLVLDIVLKQAGLGKEINHGVIRIAKVEKLQKEEEDRKKLDEAKALAGEVTTVSRPLSFAKASEAKTVIEKMLTKRGSLIVDDRTNTLIISDLPKNMSVVDELIQQLDIQIQQVQIEARVVEASGSYEKAFGVKWPTGNSGDAKLSVADSTGALKDAPWGTTNGKAWNTVNNRATPGGNGIMGNFSGGKDGVTSLTSPAGEFWVSFLSNRMSVNVILQALEKDGKVKIVSSPKVVTQNNKKAIILSGEKIPYPSQQGGAAGGAITVAFVDANLQLEVTPQITNDGTILMDLKIEKAEADFSRQVQGTPTILHKEITTQVLVKDGGTAILGGVHSNLTSKQMTGVPFLSRLPLLGFLFRTTSKSDSDSELLIFITPRILKG